MIITEADTGCWFDCARGIYIGEAVIDLAQQWGFEVSEDDEVNTLPEGEFYNELTDEAELYMQQFAPDGYYFGSNENSDWGLWSDDCEDYR